MFRLQLIQDGPGEASEFSGHGGDGNATMFSLIEVPELSGESVLGVMGDGYDGWRLPKVGLIQDHFSGC